MGDAYWYHWGQCTEYGYVNPDFSQIPTVLDHMQNTKADAGNGGQQAATKKPLNKQMQSHSAAIPQGKQESIQTLMKEDGFEEF